MSGGRRSLSTSSPAMVKSLAVRDALNMALDEELARDDKVFIMLRRILFAEEFTMLGFTFD